MEEEEYINFESIKSHIQIEDQSIFALYLKDVYKDLSARNEEKGKQGISKITFLDYFKIPVIIADKLFSAMDKDNDSVLNYKEFLEGMVLLYFGEFDQLVEFIFRIYDFGKIGKISQGEVKTILSYLPLKRIKLDHQIQMESLNEINETLKITFGNKDSLNLKEFLNVTEKRASDVFLQLLCFLYEKKPFSDKNVNSFNKMGSPKSPNFKRSPGQIKSIPSPSKKSLLSPADNFIKLSQINEKEDVFKLQNMKDENIEMVRMKNKIVFESKKSVKNAEELVMNSPTKKIANPALETILKQGKKTLDSPTAYFKKETNEIPEFSLEGNLHLMSSADDEKNNIASYEGIVYKTTQNNNLKAYWLSLQGSDIYYYKGDNNDEYQGMHNLTGCFIRENGEVVFDKAKFYSFGIIFQTKIRNYYVKEKAEMKNWVKFLKLGIGYNSFFDHYEMLEDIGEGKFGVVKLGVHKKTKNKVAIKIIKKEAMNSTDMELVRTEIDIMKLCHHKHVVKLLDHFENSDYIFIVMELLGGGDLGNFLTKKKFKISEEFASRILFQIAQGLEYLHQYGILHRDLKPDNIMLVNKDETAPIVKIMDFGLSKILGPKETVADGFGTLSFVAPEVLIRQPYNKQIDIWSLGVIMYYSLSGTLPFDDENDNEEIIAKMTVFSDVAFPEKKWKTMSSDVIDLIKKCLIKDPEKRIKIDAFLSHEWIRKHNKI